HAVPVVRVDVDVRDPMARRDRAPDREGYVVEDAESAGPFRVGVMKAAGRMERGSSMFERVIDRPGGSLCDARGGVETARERRRVAGVERDGRSPPLTRLVDQLDEFRLVERFEILPRGDRHFPNEFDGSVGREE